MGVHGVRRGVRRTAVGRSRRTVATAQTIGRTTVCCVRETIGRTCEVACAEGIRGGCELVLGRRGARVLTTTVMCRVVPREGAPPTRQRALRWAGERKAALASCYMQAGAFRPSDVVLALCRRGIYAPRKKGSINKSFALMKRRRPCPSRSAEATHWPREVVHGQAQVGDVDAGQPRGGGRLRL